MADPVVKLTEVSKSFGTVRALEGVSLEVEGQTLHAIVGENGAGKTTLMRILFGAETPDTGSIALFGKEVKFKSQREATALGIGMVAQHDSIIDDLTCLQNLCLGDNKTSWGYARKALSEAQSLAEQVGFKMDWEALGSSLGPAERQRLEILKLLWQRASLMIFDEPTAMLSPEDSKELYKTLQDLVSKGVTVLVITHRLSEVMAYCQNVTVLRGGKKVADRKVAQTSLEELSELIVGSQVSTLDIRTREAGGALLSVQNVTVKGKGGKPALDSVNFHIGLGEVVGLAGVDGNGQRELFQVLSGQIQPDSGEILFGGESMLGASTREWFTCGMRMIPEDRHRDGIIEDWSLLDNAAIGLQGLPPFAKGAWIDEAGKHSAAEAVAARFGTKHGGLENKIGNLSGGNQQRFVNGRALELSPRMVLAFQPVRGLDIDAIRLFYQGLYAECEKGACALVVSYDLDELLEFADRILVLNGGKLKAPQSMFSKDRAEIGKLMVGG